MSNNFQMFQYDGSQYNQLIPNSSNTAINSTQLCGIDGTMYATKEYVDEKQAFNILEVFNDTIQKNSTSIQLTLKKLTKTDFLKASFITFKFSNIPQQITVSLLKYNSTYRNLPIYTSSGSGAGTLCITLNCNQTVVENQNRIVRLWNDPTSTVSGIYLMLYNSDNFYTFLSLDNGLTTNVTLKIYVYVPKI